MLHAIRLEGSMQRVRLPVLVGSAAIVCGCNTRPDPFKPVPECIGPTVSAFMGDRQLVVSSLAIADANEGFDLDLDGKIDNKLAPLGVFANPQLMTSFTAKHDIVLPLELFGYAGADTSCTKLDFYVGKFNQDRDADGKDTSWDNGDCDDTDPGVHPGVTQTVGGRFDMDCDGYADNPTRGTPPADTQDLDGDGYSLAQGDCDDRADAAHVALARMRHPGAKEICGQGIDMNCDGIPDNDPDCDPFAGNDLTMMVQPLSFDTAGNPLITFKDGKVSLGVLSGGPDRFDVSVPIQASNIVTLQLTGARIKMPLSDDGASKKTTATGGLLGGVLEAVSLYEIKGISAASVIKPDETLLDAVFVGPVAAVLALDTDKDGHYLPDIDVDGDGLETFWQSAPTTGTMHVDTCKDGDGTIIHGLDCPLAKDGKGRYRFVDGLSVALKFNAVPAKLAPQK
jgi:hypothetical protein